MSEPVQDSRCLLVSMPQMDDPQFYQSVILLAEYMQENAMGLILNHLTNGTLDQAIASSDPLYKTLPVFFGGPVQSNRGSFIHAYPDISSEGLALPGGIYLHGSIQVMKQIIAQHHQDEYFFFRFFVGYCGWGEGQLEKEMSTASWLSHAIDKEFIFMTSPEKLWEHSIQRLGVHPGNLVSPDSSGEAH